MEKMRPLDAKLKHQIDHLLSSTSLRSSLSLQEEDNNDQVVGGGGAEGSSQLLKPNLSGLLSSSDDDSGGEDEPVKKVGVGSKKGGSQVYVPPRTQSVAYNVRARSYHNKVNEVK